MRVQTVARFLSRVASRGVDKITNWLPVRRARGDATADAVLQSSGFVNAKAVARRESEVQKPARTAHLQSMLCLKETLRALNVWNDILRSR